MLADAFAASLAHKPAAARPKVSGSVTQVKGNVIEARGINVRVGDRCLIHLSSDATSQAEVIGFREDVLVLMPLYPLRGLSAGCKVERLDGPSRLPSGPELLGRVVDGAGQALDGLGVVQSQSHVKSETSAINPLLRKPIDQPLDVGVRAINAVATVGCGQRIGLFAGSGVGKSLLLAMITRYTTADVVVVALVGERGREVREFIEQTLAKTSNKNHIVVAATAEATPLMRLKAGVYASQLAEHFRDKGQRVLLLFDSLTRFAQAQREIGLALGEPPATQGYPASVFTLIPQLVERAGNGDSSGSVTGIYTVLTEGDDLQDPVAESARAILDGHLVLSRELSEEGIYPALDLTKSVSRVMPQVVSSKHVKAAAIFKQWLARYESIKDLLRIGAYQAGEDAETDTAVQRYPYLRDFIRQEIDNRATFPESLDALFAVLDGGSNLLAGSPLAAQGGQSPALGSSSASNPIADQDLQSVRAEFNEELSSHPSITGQ